MIQRAFITEWRSRAPWSLDSQVEQDLILVRALVDIYSEEIIRSQVALRGGTAWTRYAVLPVRERNRAGDLDAA